MREILCWMTVGVAVAVLWAWSRPLEAAEFHVTSKAELSTALDTAETNGEEDTIYLAAGTYYGNFEYRPPSTEYHSLTIRGEPGTTAQDVILDGENSGRVLTIYYWSGPSHPPSFLITIEGLTIQNGDSSSEMWYEGGGIRASGSTFKLTLRHCIVRQNTAKSQGGGMYLWPADTLILDGNVIYGNTTIEESFSKKSQGAGIYMYTPGAAFHVRNNVFFGNTAQGTSPKGGGLFVDGSGSGTIHFIHNTLAGNNAASGGGVYFDSVWKVNAYNNIVHGNSGTEGKDIFFADDGADERVGYNNDYENMYGTWTESGGNINQTPLFVDPAGSDYHLSSDSPCIDQGSNEAPELPNNDLDGEPRVWDGDGDGTAVADMGADEYYEVPEGTIGTVLSLTCQGMGEKKPRVYLQYEKKPGKLGKKAFKVMAMANSTITCLWKKRLPPATYDLYIKPKGKGAEPIPMGSFAIKGPSISGVNPGHGTPGTVIEVTGDFFSSKKPKVYLQDPISSKKKRCKVLDWQMDPSTAESTLTFVVRKLPPGNYKLILKNKIGEDTWGGFFTVE